MWKDTQYYVLLPAISRVLKAQDIKLGPHMSSRAPLLFLPFCGASAIRLCQAVALLSCPVCASLHTMPACRPPWAWSCLLPAPPCMPGSYFRMKMKKKSGSLGGLPPPAIRSTFLFQSIHYLSRFSNLKKKILQCFFYFPFL
jgi:hypothetical protein